MTLLFFFLMILVVLSAPSHSCSHRLCTCLLYRAGSGGSEDLIRARICIPGIAAGKENSGIRSRPPIRFARMPLRYAKLWPNACWFVKWRGGARVVPSAHRFQIKFAEFRVACRCLTLKNETSGYGGSALKTQ